MTYVIAFISSVLAGLWIIDRLAPNMFPFLPLGGDETTQTAIILMVGFIMLTIVSLWEVRDARKK